LYLPGEALQRRERALCYNPSGIRDSGFALRIEDDMRDEGREVAERIWRAAVGAVGPGPLVLRAAGRVRHACAAFGCGRAIVIAFGKGAVEMAGGALAALGDLVSAAVIVAPLGSASPAPDPRLRLFHGGHPLPDDGSLRGAEEALRLVREAGDETLILCLVSGGGSALLAAPADGIVLDEKRETTRLLLQSGADIAELNTVRKHLSRVKGGRLAEAASPAPVVSLILSDVVGDPLEIIASGPTAPDPATYADALAVLERRGIEKAVPAAVRELLRKGEAGLLPETPKPGNALFRRVENIVVGNIAVALATAAEEAKRLGFDVELLPAPVTGEAREAGRILARLAIERSRRKGRFCLLSGGETVVTVRGRGRGGRNQELALAFALEAEGVPDLLLLSAGTDGRDGPTEAAGAFAGGGTASQARRRGLSPESSLEENDSATFFEALGGSFITGPTGTNVMDIQIILGGGGCAS
jgi:glycerate 2-kinase